MIVKALLCTAHKFAVLVAKEFNINMFKVEQEGITNAQICQQVNVLDIIVYSQ